MREKHDHDQPQDSFAKDFGPRLKVAREAANLSMSELAARMALLGWDNYRPMTVSRTEAGTRAVRLDEAMALSNILGEHLDLMAAIEPSSNSLRYRLQRDAVMAEEARQKIQASTFTFMQTIYGIFTDLEDYEAQVRSAEVSESTKQAAERVKSLLVEGSVATHVLDAIEDTEALGFQVHGLRYALASFLSEDVQERAKEMLRNYEEMQVMDGRGGVDAEQTERANWVLLAEAEPPADDRFQRYYIG